MKRLVHWAILGLSLASLLWAGCDSVGDSSNWSSGVTELSVSAGSPAQYKGNISEGETMSLDFADNSSVACFPGTENLNFSGPHVLFATEQPPHSELKVSVTPAAGVDVSLYAYQIGLNSYVIPPDLQSCVTCEAGFDQQHDSNPGEMETVKLQAINNGYNVVIGVAGPKGVNAGDFTLKLELMQ